jgi:hypothetical protein
MLCEEGLRFHDLLDQDILIGAPAKEVIEGEFWERQLRRVTAILHQVVVLTCHGGYLRENTLILHLWRESLA